MPSKTFAAALLRWHGKRGRDLPWRRTGDPYAIWVSEIMLQQTRVETVIPYYRRWLKRFPDVLRLAGASREDVLKAWEGLGYYARARHLHDAARIVRKQLGGRMPSSVKELRELPGIGPYTAGAIASIAFGLDEPVLDGNVARVLSRFFRLRGDIKNVRTQRKLWALARAMIPAGRAGPFNQAVMDLGATVCTPRRPQCNRCPLRRWCEARARGEQERIPRQARRPPLPHHDICAAVVWRGSRVLIDRRPSEGLLGGLWEFPGGKRERCESLETCVRREVKEELGIAVKVLRPLMKVKHAYTHFRITLHVFECAHVSGRPRRLRCDAWKWVAPKELRRYAFPKANQPIIAALQTRRRCSHGAGGTIERVSTGRFPHGRPRRSRG